RPASAASLRMSSFGWATPVTAIPYFGSGSSIECPPATGQFAAAATSSPPRSTSVSSRSEEHTSELQSRFDLVCRRLLEKKKQAENVSQIGCHISLRNEEEAVRSVMLLRMNPMTACSVGGMANARMQTLTA